MYLQNLEVGKVTIKDNYIYLDIYEKNLINTVDVDAEMNISRIYSFE